MGVPPCSCQKRSANFCAFVFVPPSHCREPHFTILIDYILWINREYSNKNNISYPDLMDFGLWITNTPDHPLGSDGNIVHSRAPLPATLDSRGTRHLLHRPRRQQLRRGVCLLRVRAGPTCGSHMTKDEARKIAAGIAKVPELLLRPDANKRPA